MTSGFSRYRRQDHCRTVKCVQLRQNIRNCTHGHEYGYSPLQQRRRRTTLRHRTNYCSYLDRNAATDIDTNTGQYDNNLATISVIVTPL
jgi:hypothetical protein